MGEHRRHLTNYLLDKRLQLRYVAIVALVSAAVCALLGWLIWEQQSDASRAVMKGLASIDYLSPEDKALVVGHINDSDLHFVLVMALVCVGLILVLSLFLVVLTHKAAGPLYKIGHYFDEIAAGKLPVATDLRRGDQFKRVFEKFRHMIDAVRGRAAEDAKVFGAFIAACREAGVGTSGELGHGLEELGRRKVEKEEAVAG